MALDGEIEEIHRAGKYQEGQERPLKVRFRSQVSAEEVLAGAWKYARTHDFKNIWMKRDMDMDEREKHELVQEAKEKNAKRTE